VLFLRDEIDFIGVTPTVHTKQQSLH